jgi:hypothetical protein
LEQYYLFGTDRLNLKRFQILGKKIDVQFTQDSGLSRVRCRQVTTNLEKTDFDV